MLAEWRRTMRFAFVAILVAACAAPAPDDADLDSDPDLDTIGADDSMPEEDAVDGESSEAALAFKAECTKRRYLHVSNFSFVAPLDCVNGVCPNGCWGYQRRTSGFACDYNASQGDFLSTRPGDGPFASYNEIKPLNQHDAVAVAACRTQS